MELPFLLISLLIIFIFSAFPSCRCEEDANFTVCDLPYECGNVKNLSFPFWGDSRPQSCGHPRFELRCEREEYPVMDINEVEYRVLNVSQENSTMTLARSDLWDSPCSPGPVNTTFTPPPFFNYTQGVVNLTLFYHCPKVDFFPYNFSCPGQDVGDNSYYHKGDFVNDNSPFLNELWACGSFVKVPVFESALDDLPDQNGLEDVRKALREGFGMNYTEFPHCRACEISGGRCGTSDDAERFCCYCRNGTEELICPHEDSNFTTCGRPYECGSIKNLSFPFWGDDRPEFCGREGFQLRCENREYPVINISGIEYGVLHVSQENRMMTLARSDLWDSPCSGNAISTTLNHTFFLDYAPTVENLTLIYGCPIGESLGGSLNLLNNFSCPEDTDSNDRISYYARENVWSTLNHAHFQSECGGVFQVPVFRTVLDEMESSAERGIQELTDVLKQGFDVNYIPFPYCSECEKVQGRCGTHTTTGTFVCYCPEGTNYECLRLSGNGSNWKLKVGIGAACGGSVLLLICVMTCCLRSKILVKSWTKKTKNDQDLEAFIRSYGHLTTKQYRFLDIKKMTKSFKEKLGQGGYGKVYRGKLPDGRLVAVKILNASKGNGEEFINEVASISRTSHVNIVTLLGFCLEGHRRALIYEFMPNGSLEKFTYKEKPLQTSPHLEWEKLLQISIGIARGLEYLHRGCNTKILHLDIKPHNILLDEDFSPKISDFGLAKLCPRKDSIVSIANARGTIGYIAPEVFSRNFGGVSSKSDVYSYGMMILEMVGGRKNIKVGVSHTSEIYFPDWIYKHLQLGSNLHWGEDMTNEENEMARKMILVGLWCIQTKSSDRPSMSKVIEMLQGSLEALHIPPNPSMFSPRSPEILPAEPLAESSTTSGL